jgi:hypothetical protein
MVRGANISLLSEIYTILSIFLHKTLLLVPYNKIKMNQSRGVNKIKYYYRKENERLC